MCKTRVENREDIIVNTAAGSTNLAQNDNTGLSDWELISIAVLVVMMLYIAYHYLKVKFTKRVSHEVNRQAVTQEVNRQVAI